MMRKLLLSLFVATFVSVVVGVAHAELILFEDFEDSTGFTIGGGVPHSWIYWGIAPINGTASVPSNFVQGGNQSGNIFFGSFAKAIGEPSPTMTINLPDLSGYTGIFLNVSIAAPEAIWENSHRDSLHITGDTNPIDSFLPTAFRRSFLHSKVHSQNLLLQFQDFGYAINSDISSLTFTFASTDYPEIIGIDSVRITGNPIPEPTTLPLLLIGLIGLCASFRERCEHYRVSKLP
jgi:hypothetical protein